MPTHFFERYRGLLLLALFFIISRLVFASSTPYVWDSVNFALGLKDFSIADGQPHFPGYLFYVLMGKAVHLLFENPFRAIIGVNLIFGLLTFWLLYKLAKLLDSVRAGVAACTLFVFNPLAWFYGEVAEIYMAEAALSAAFGFFSLKYALAPRHRSLLPASLVLGLIGGFRLNLEIFLFPLWLYLLLNKKSQRGKILPNLLVCVGANLLWLIPTLLHVGGWSRFLALSDATVGTFLRSSSIFFGGNLATHAKMAGRAAAWMGIFFGPVLAVSFLILKKGIRLPRGERPFLFFTFWVGPALAFFFLFYIAKPGYLLIFLPPLFTVAGVLLSRTFPKPLPMGLVLTVLCLPGMVYLFSPGVKQDEMRLRLGVDGVAKSKLKRLFRYTIADIKFSDQKNALYVRELGISLKQDAEPIFIFSNFSDWSFRAARYYFPNVPSHLVSFDGNFKFVNHDIYWNGRSHEVSYASVEAGNRAVYLFLSPFSPQRAGLAGFEFTPIPHLDDCVYFPPGVISRVEFSGDQLLLKKAL